MARASTAVRVMAIASDCLHAVKPDEPDVVCARKRFRTDDIKGYLYTRYRSPVVAAAVSFITFKTLFFAPSLLPLPNPLRDCRSPALTCCSPARKTQDDETKPPKGNRKLMERARVRLPSSCHVGVFFYVYLVCVCIYIHVINGAVFLVRPTRMIDGSAREKH